MLLFCEDVGISLQMLLPVRENRDSFGCLLIPAQNRVEIFNPHSRFQLWLDANPKAGTLGFVPWNGANEQLSPLGHLESEHNNLGNIGRTDLCFLWARRQLPLNSTDRDIAF